MSEASDNQYLIWSNEHRAWWGPGHCGYTRGLRDAGRYSRDQAIQVCRDAIPTAMHVGTISEIPVRAADVTDFLKGQMVPGTIMDGAR
jgi:hypothetical protein